MNPFVPTVLVVLPLAGASSASASLLFDQFAGTAATTNTWSSQFDTNLPLVSQVADDFTLGTNATVQTIRFWGGFYNGSPTTISSFNVRVYADAGGLPTGTPGDPSGTALHSFTVSATALDTGAFVFGNSIFRYDVNLGAGFLAAAGTTYWLSIQSVLSYPPQWGWASQASTGNSAALWGPVFGINTWRSDVILGDTQFQLFGATGGGVPLPGAAGLAALGLFGACGRRGR